MECPFAQSVVAVDTPKKGRPIFVYAMIIKRGRNPILYSQFQ